MLAVEARQLLLVAVGGACCLVEQVAVQRRILSEVGAWREVG